MSDVLSRLVRTIDSRKVAGPARVESHVADLLAGGPLKCAEKFGEESVEAIIACVAGDRENLTREAADVVFHLLVMLAAGNVRFDDVLVELERREGMSGVAEKRQRDRRP